MLEPKVRNMPDDKEVVAKRDAAIEWCRNATDHAKTYGGKSWRYILIPHDVISENMIVTGLGPIRLLVANEPVGSRCKTNSFR